MLETPEYGRLATQLSSINVNASGNRVEEADCSHRSEVQWPQCTAPLLSLDNVPIRLLIGLRFLGKWPHGT